MKHAPCKFTISLAIAAALCFAHTSFAAYVETQNFASLQTLRPLAAGEHEDEPDLPKYAFVSKDLESDIEIIVRENIVRESRAILAAGIMEITRRITRALGWPKDRPVIVEVSREDRPIKELKIRGGVAVARVDITSSKRSLSKWQERNMGEEAIGDYTWLDHYLDTGRVAFTLGRQLGQIRRDTAGRQEYEADEDGVACLLRLGFKPEEINGIVKACLPPDFTLETQDEREIVEERLARVAQLLRDSRFLQANEALYPRQDFEELAGFVSGIPTPHPWLRAIGAFLNSLLRKQGATSI